MASKECVITDYGADSEAANNTAAIAAAFAACASGGTVIVADGHFKTGPLLESDATKLFLEVRAGAALVAAFGPSDWPVVEQTALSREAEVEGVVGLRVDPLHQATQLV